jgi:aminoglycoside phosphotransferase (APT) family kinase protein
MDRETLTELLRDRWRPDAEVRSCERGPVGNGQEVWFVSADTDDGTTELVIRRTAPSGPLDWTDRRTEYDVLDRLGGTGIPVPEVLFFEPGGGVLERDAFAMTRVEGRPIRRDPPEVVEAAVSDMGRWMARLHALPALEPMSRDAANQAQVAKWKAQYVERRPGSIPLMGALFAWLEVNRPARPGAAVTLWGDPGIHNVLHENGTITALLDWELSHTGDPLEDVAGGMWSVSSTTDANTLLSAYTDETGTPVDPDALQWFQVLATLSRGVMLVNGIANVLDGSAWTPSLVGLGLHLLPTTLRQAADLAGWQEDSERSPSTPDETRESNAGTIRPDVAEMLTAVSRFLERDVLPTAEAAVIRRGLKTSIALLQTTAVRHEIEPAIERSRRHETASVLAHLESKGVATHGGLEATAVRIEHDETLAEHRPRMRAHLLADLGAQRALLGPLEELYG